MSKTASARPGLKAMLARIYAWDAPQSRLSSKSVVTGKGQFTKCHDQLLEIVALERLPVDLHLIQDAHRLQHF